MGAAIMGTAGSGIAAAMAMAVIAAASWMRQDQGEGGKAVKMRNNTNRKKCCPNLAFASEGGVDDVAARHHLPVKGYCWFMDGKRRVKKSP
jgi:hypothetical protein